MTSTRAPSNADYLQLFPLYSSKMTDSISLQLLPSLPEDITASWLGSALGHELKSIEITDCELNATASKILITITYENNDSCTPRPKFVCIKGGFNPVMLAMEGYGEILKIVYSREVKFFNLVVPSLTNMSVPKSWWAGENLDQGQGIVIMDDLNHGYTFGDPAEDWPVERVMFGVEQLAALHARTWGVSATGELSWLTPTYEHVMVGLTMNWDAMVLSNDRPPIPEQIRGQERTVAALKKHFATKNPRFLCMLHGDPHTGNTFLDADGNPYFLDWQLVHVGPAFHDFAYFVVGALSTEDRRAHEIAILDHYLHALARLGGPTLSTRDEEVMKEYSKSTMSGLGWILTPYEMQGRARVFAMSERYGAAMLDHRTIELIESLPEPSA